MGIRFMADQPVTDETLPAFETVMNDVLGGAPDEVVRQVYEALAVYIGPARNSQEEVAKASRLRAAFVAVSDWLLGKRLPHLNDAQWLFLCTGALGANVMFKQNGLDVDVELVPAKVYELLVQGRAAKAQRPPWAVSILDAEDRVNAIARGELIGLDNQGTSRRRRAAKPLGSDQLKDKLRGRLESLVAAAKEALNAVEAQVGAFGNLRDEKMFNSTRLNVEALKKYVQLVGRAGQHSEQELKLLSSVGEKLSGIVQSIQGLGAQLEKTGRELAARTQTLAAKVGEVKLCRAELGKVEAGQASATAAFDPDTIASIRRDGDTLAAFVVSGAESSENKVAFSGSRILVKEQWEEFTGPPEEFIATVPGVIAAIEKISKIHINVFPKDQEGHFIIPPIIIEPIRNFVEYFDDRIVMSLVSGEYARKGPKISLTPLEVQVLKACGQYLSKDPLYDFHGDLNVGTFIGDYSGKVERKTQTMWAGAEKKLTLAMSSQVVDSASRTESVRDYMDCVFALANGLMPPQKLSRRKLAVLLRYCMIESVERTVALVLLYVTQAETSEAKTTILKYCKTEAQARELVSEAFQDPQVAKVCGDRDFFLTKLFGR